MLLATINGKKQFHPNVLECFEREDNAKLIQLLQKAELDDVVDCSGTTLLHLSAKYGNGRITKYLEQSACDVDVQDNDGMTPLMVAVKHRQFDQVLLLFELKADMGIKNNSGKSALKMALEMMNTDGRFMFLLLDEIGCLKNHQKALKIINEAECKLYHAVYTNSSKIITLLISNGHSINEQNRANGNTALLTAASLGYVTVINTLLEHGADPTIRNYDGYLPFMFTLCSSLGQKKEEVMKFCKSISNWTEKNKHNGKLNLHPIFARGDKQTVQLFLKTYHIDLEARDIHGLTPIHYLIENSHVEAIDVLQDMEMALNMQDSSGRTPLHVAVLRMSRDNVELLLKKGANANVKDDQGRTPLFYAFLEDSEESDKDDYEGLKLMSLLLEHGADPEIMLDNEITIIAEGVNNSACAYLLKPIVSHLAMHEMLGKSIHHKIRKQIISKTFLKSHYETCCLHLQKMKKNIIYSKVTLFDILTNTDRKLREYATKRENVIKIIRTKRDQITDSYYESLLENKVEKIIEFAGMKDEFEKAKDDCLKPLVKSFMEFCGVKDEDD